MNTKFLKSLLSNDESIPSPFHSEGKIKKVYVMINNTERLGYLIFWCDKTFKGGQISRLKIPEDSKYLIPENLTKELPNIELIDLEDIK